MAFTTRLSPEAENKLNTIIEKKNFSTKSKAIEHIINMYNELEDRLQEKITDCNKLQQENQEMRVIMNDFVSAQKRLINFTND